MNYPLRVIPYTFPLTIFIEYLGFTIDYISRHRAETLRYHYDKVSEHHPI